MKRLLLVCLFISLSIYTAENPQIEEKPFVIAIASYNNKHWYKKNLESVFSQNYSNYRVIYTDDVSTDGTSDYVEFYIDEKKVHSKIQLIKNKKKKGALGNYYSAIHSCRPDEIIIILDGDDWLYDNNVLSTLNKVYSDPNVWLTYGQLLFYIGDYRDPVAGIVKEIPINYIKNNTTRENPWPVTHLRSFYAGLFHKIKKEDLLFHGNFFQTSCDVAMMVPLVELAGEHTKFISKVLYVYNRDNLINSDKVFASKQGLMDKIIRKRPKYLPAASIQ